MKRILGSFLILLLVLTLTSVNVWAQAMNPSAFVQPDLGTIGNMRPANVEGPGGWKLDTAITRIFQIRENQRLEFRGEAFNVTNSLIPGNPTNSLSSNTFGQILTSGDARVMQFALKYSF